MDTIKSKEKKLQCSECKNEFELDAKVEGDICECPHCGIEYEVVNENNGEVEVMMMEEEK